MKWGMVSVGVARAYSEGPTTTGCRWLLPPGCARLSERQEARAPARTTRCGGGTVGWGGGGSPKAGKPGGVKGGPGAESWSSVGFPSHQIRALPFTCERTSERRRTDGLASPGAREVEMAECGVRSA